MFDQIWSYAYWIACAICPPNMISEKIWSFETSANPEIRDRQRSPAAVVLSFSSYLFSLRRYAFCRRTIVELRFNFEHHANEFVFVYNFSYCSIFDISFIVIKNLKIDNFRFVKYVYVDFFHYKNVNFPYFCVKKNVRFFFLTNVFFSNNIWKLSWMNYT